MDVLPSEYYQVSFIDIGQAGDMLTAMLSALAERALPGDAGVEMPSAATGSLANIRALAAVSFQRGEALGSSVILYIAEPQS